MKHPKLQSQHIKCISTAAMEFMKRIQEFRNLRMDWGVTYIKKTSQNLLEKAIYNFNMYLLTSFKSFQNKTKPNSAVLKLKTNKCFYYHRV